MHNITACACSHPRCTQVTKFLVDDSEVGEWTLQGLPTDELSIQNGIMVTRASRYPVLVDPQGQGRIWIMNREEANQLKITQLNDKMFRNHLEDCLSFGKPLLLENIEEELDPVLDPVLERRLIKKGKSYVIPLADKEVDFTETFRLFCTTRLPNPHFTPELSAKVRGAAAAALAGRGGVVWAGRAARVLRRQQLPDCVRWQPLHVDIWACMRGQQHAAHYTCSQQYARCRHAVICMHAC